jgi:hypothetical protein
MTAQPLIPSQPKHPLHALTTHELRDYRRDLEHAIHRLASGDPAHAGLRARLDAVIAEQQSRAQLARTETT